MRLSALPGGDVFFNKTLQESSFWEIISLQVVGKV